MKNISHEFYICRAIYQDTRRRLKAPAVKITRLSENQCCGEMADGSALMEHVSGCCKWAMKTQVLEEWERQKNKTPNPLGNGVL